MAKKEVKSSMSEFFPESVASAVIPVVKQNTPFIFADKGKHYYIGMLLDVAKIGGVSKKTVNDKDKGGVIELIKNGNIDAYVTAELNDSNQLLFIPTIKTIDHLGDYGVFRKVSGYEFVKLNDKLEIVEHTEVFGTYDQFRQIATGQANIKDYVKSADVIVAGSAEDPTVSHNIASQAVNKAKDIANAVSEIAATKIAPVASKVVENVKEKIADSSGIKDMQAKPAEKPAEKPKEEPKPEEPPKEEQKPAEEAKPAETKPAAPVEDEEEAVYTETQVLSSVERIFHADNLDLPLSTEPFDQIFTVNNHLIKFDIDPRDTYVNEHLNHMALEANRDLQKMRADNLRRLREKYFMLMSARIVEIQKILDINNKNTNYGAFKDSIDSQKAANLSNIAAMMDERQQKLEEAYNKRLEEYCELRAKEARAEYKEKYQRQHQADMAAIEGNVRAEIEATYNAALNELYLARRNDALTTLDLNITGVLQELMEDYKQMFEEETKFYNVKAEEMRNYSKELHQLDAKRLAVEEERNRITNEVNDARAEASAKIALIKSEYEGAQQALEARSTASIMQAENETKLIKDQLESRTLTFMQDKDSLQKQLDAAIERADKAVELAKADYEHRLIQAQDDRDSWKQTLDAYKDQHRHNNRLAAILVIAITIAAIAGGFVAGGVYWNRIVANELAGGSGGNSEIKVITSETAAVVDEPELSETEQTASDAADEALNSETEEAVTTVPASDDDINETSVTTTAVTRESQTTTVTSGHNEFQAAD